MLSHLPVDQAMVERQLKLSTQVKTGGGWLIFVGFASALNSVILASGGSWTLIMGLGFTEILAYLAQEAILNAGAVVFATICIGLGFCFLGRMGQRQYLWAFIVGITLYAVDGLIYLLVQEWVSLGFHVFALFGMVRGAQAIAGLQALRTAEAHMIVHPDGNGVNFVPVQSPSSQHAFTAQRRRENRATLRIAAVALAITLAFMGFFAFIFLTYPLQLYDLSLAEVYASLAYYFDHRDAIEQAIAADDALVQALRERIPSKLAQKLQI